MAFVEVTDLGKLERLFTESGERPVILFKHSLTCPISRAAYEEMSLMDREQVALVIVQDSRAVSNEIAQRTGVRHESPQTIILQGGEVAWHASHFDITKAAVTRALHEIEQ